MANLTCDWPRFGPVALVLLGWFCFAAALVIGDPFLKVLFLVAARALPRALP